jgi:hypothetical protein
MTLEQLFQGSVSVFCIVATIFMVTAFVWAIMLHSQLSKLMKKLEEITEIAKATAGDAQEFVEQTIHSLEKFKQSIFTFDFIKQIITSVVGLIKNNSKGKKDGQED